MVEGSFCNCTRGMVVVVGYFFFSAWGEVVGSFSNCKRRLVVSNFFSSELEVVVGSFFNCAWVVVVGCFLNLLLVSCLSSFLPFLSSAITPAMAVWTCYSNMAMVLLFLRMVSTNCRSENHFQIDLCTSVLTFHNKFCSFSRAHQAFKLGHKV